jgi:hypothetical protein
VKLLELEKEIEWCRYCIYSHEVTTEKQVNPWAFTQMLFKGMHCLIGNFATRVDLETLEWCKSNRKRLTND